MADYLVIVESPAKAKTIGKFLGKDYKIEASMGHIRDLPKSQIGVDVDNNFEPKYITIRGKGDLLAKLRKAAKGVKKIFLASDPDREGEAISWHLAHLLKIDQKEKCRISFNEITKNAVKNAILKPRVIDTTLVDAQQARRILDRIVGYKISPLLWKKVRKGLSAGRVQSVTTKMICDREEEINNFVSEEFWTIVAKVTKKGKKEKFDAKFYGENGEKLELTSEAQVNKILKDIGKSKFIVKKVKTAERKRNPAAPFITSTLQQEAARKLGYTTKKTMIVAQQLYEGIEVKGHGSVGLVTYIRTDSVRISSEASDNVRNLIKNKYGDKYLPEQPRVYKNKNASQDAHEAIRPTYFELDPLGIKESLSNEQYKLYKLIWERFLASQMATAIYDTVTADIDVAKYQFKSNGSKVKFPGFMTLYTEGKDEDTDDEDANIPELKEKEELDLNKLEEKQHFTQPPARYNEASLVKMLEEKGIGRPSTYAPTISTILARGYVEKEQKMLAPTELGIIVTDIMKNHFKDIVDVSFTAQMEGRLDEIEEGNKNWKEIIGEFYKGFSVVLSAAEEEIGDIQVPDVVSDIPCEKCGKLMVFKLGRFGKFLACPGFPECRNAKAIVEEAGVLCPKCNGKVLNKKTKKSRRYLGCEHNPQCDYMTWDKLINKACPKCNSFLLSKAKGKKSTSYCSNEKCDYTE